LKLYSMTEVQQLTTEIPEIPDDNHIG
jgi:hypothetical protein